MTITIPDLPKLTRETVVWAAVAMLAFAGGYQLGKHGLPDFTPRPIEPPPVVVPVTKVTAVTYFYEKDEGGVPSGVTKAISVINDQNIVATTFEEDATTPGGAVPKQYAVSLPAARTAGLPALVVMGGDKVLRIVKAPKTEAEVLGAIAL